MLNRWNNIKANIAQMEISYESDIVFGFLTANKMFATKSVYQLLEKEIPEAHNKWIRRSKLPLKTKYKFMWQLQQDALSTS
jgi:hypothetical protein